MAQRPAPLTVIVEFSTSAVSTLKAWLPQLVKVRTESSTVHAPPLEALPVDAGSSHFGVGDIELTIAGSDSICKNDGALKIRHRQFAVVYQIKRAAIVADIESGAVIVTCGILSTRYRHLDAVQRQIGIYKGERLGRAARGRGQGNSFSITNDGYVLVGKGHAYTINFDVIDQRHGVAALGGVDGGLEGLVRHAVHFGDGIRGRDDFAGIFV